MWLHIVIDCRKDIGGWKDFQSLQALETLSITCLTQAILHGASMFGSVDTRQTTRALKLLGRSPF